MSRTELSILCLFQNITISGASEKEYKLVFAYVLVLTHFGRNVNECIQYFNLYKSWCPYMEIGITLLIVVVC